MARYKKQYRKDDNLFELVLGIGGDVGENALIVKAADIFDNA